MKNVVLKNVLFAFGLLIGSIGAYSQSSFLSASGTKIVNASGSDVLLKGVNLGGWVLQEGWMISSDGNMPGTQSEMKKMLYDAGQTEARVEAYYQGWRDNFITKADIDYIASKGMNCVRFPMHYELFLTAGQRAVRNSVIKNKANYASYKTQLAGWISSNTIATDYTAEGYRLIDNLLSWCAANNIYVVLDMHAVPGSQGTDEHIADCISLPNDLWYSTVNQDVLNAIWDNISKRYKNNSTVAMYDVINEPNNANVTAMHTMYQRLITTIRNNADNHLILLEGNAWGNNYASNQPDKFSPRTNLVFNIHRYGTTTSTTTTMPDPNQIQELGNAKNFMATYQVPIFCGETGLNSDATWFSNNIKAMSDVGIGWCIWSYKWHTDWNKWGFGRVPGSYPGDGVGAMANVLESIKFANMVKNDNPAYWQALLYTPVPVVPVIKVVPGKIEAEGFDVNSGFTSEACSDLLGGEDLGWTDAGDYLDFNVDVAAAGSYTISFRIANESMANAQIQLLSGSSVLATTSVDVTGGWQKWKDMTSTVFTLAKGAQTLRIKALTAGFNINYVQITASIVTPLDELFSEISDDVLVCLNPVTDRLSVMSKSKDVTVCNILDLSGKILISESSSVGEFNAIDVANLSNGLYVVQLISTCGIRTKKLIKL